METTFVDKSVGEFMETVIGDEKQTDFFPRIKFKKWDNECNLSIGVDDSGGSFTKLDGLVEWSKGNIKARFYSVKAEEKPLATSLEKIVGMASMTPQEAAAEYELFRKSGHYRFSCIWYTVTQPSLMLFSNNPASRYIQLNNDKTATDSNGFSVPVVRVPGHPGANPYYMDSNLINIDIHFGHLNVPDINSKWVQAVTEIIEGYGISVTRGVGMKLYFEHNGNLVKFHSAENTQGILAGYLNLNCDYNRCYDFYRPDVVKDIRDAHAYGLWTANPNIPNTVVNDIFIRFTQLLSIPLLNRSYTASEISSMNKTMVLQDNIPWLSQGRRTDAGYQYWPKEDGYEFEIELSSKPASNIIPLSIQTKGLSFHYQPPLTDEQAKDSFRPPHVEGSYAVYREDGKANDHYKTGKIFHIYRPYATAANGNSVWCDLSVGSTIDMIIPQEFLDNSVYPIVVDPTFGYQTAGASSVTCSGSIRALVLSGTWGQYTHMYAYRSTASSGTAVLNECAVYNDTTEAFIQETDEKSTTVTEAAAWVKYTLDAPVTLATGTTYRLAIWGNNPGGYQITSIFYDTLASAGKNKTVTYAAAWPNPLSTMTTDSNRYSIYITGNDPVMMFGCNF